MPLPAQQPPPSAAAAAPEPERWPTASGPRPEVAPVLQVQGLRKRFVRDDGSVVPAVDGVSFDLHPGELMVLLGPSGCGKTTLLRAIAGLERPDEGVVRIDGQTVFSSEPRVLVRPERRRLSMVFQSYALWPHMTVLENVAYPLKNGPTKRLGKEERAERVRSMLATMRLQGLERQYPNQLSGGQQQRVALCRALVAGSKVILFDEPLSNVDAKVREELRIELRLMQQQFGFAALFVTHDQQEAMALANTITLLDEGKVVQIGTPKELYRSPATVDVASFFGVANTVPGRVVGDADAGSGLTVQTSLGAIRCRGAGRRSPVPGDEVTVVWRPERCQVLVGAGRDRDGLVATVEESWYYGTHAELLVTAGDHTFRVHIPHDASLTRGSAVVVVLDPEVTLAYLQSDLEPAGGPA